MSGTWSQIALREILSPVSRPTPVSPGQPYRLLGARWYAKGLYVKEEKDGGEIRASTLYAVEPGDFVYNRLFAWKGSFALATEGERGCYVSNEFPCFSVNRDRVEPDWIRLYFSQEQTWLEALGMSSGSTPTSRNRLQEDRFLGVRIPLPPLPEQRRIAMRVEAVSTLAAEASRLRERSKEESAALLRAALRKNREDVLRTAPSSPLSALVTTVGGGTPSKTNPFFWDGDIPWVSPKDMKTFRLRNAKDHISRAAVNGSAVSIVRAGAVLVVTRGMILAHTFPVAVTEIDLTINQDMKAFIPGESLDPYYLAFMLRGAEQEILSKVERSSHDTRRLASEAILQTRIPVPIKLSDQHRAVDRMKDLETKFDALRILHAQTKEELEALMPCVLAAAFAGP